MKAMQAMVLMIFINAAIVFVTLFGIYNIGLTTPPTYDVSEVNTGGPINMLKLFFNGWTILAMAGGIVAGAIIAWVAKVPADRGAVYIAFVTVFWASVGSTAGIFWSISEAVGEFAYVIQMFLAIFFLAVGILFAFGFMQMVTGGWKGFQ